MKFEIKNRWDGKLIFKLECKSLKICLEEAIKAKADLGEADLRGADLCGADLGDADLRGADLRDAYLHGAYLRGADLGGADLRGADLGGKVKIQKTPLQILGLLWDIIVFDTHLKIGCEFHTIKEWSEFNDDTIKNMDTRALGFWKESKSFILDFCKANRRG